MENIWEYPVHPLALLFPPLTPEKYAELVASIMDIGLLDPIIVWQGHIIDGLHRLRACKEAGVEPRYKVLDDDDDPVKYVIAKNGLRREMDESQRAVVAHELSRWSAPGRPRENAGNCSPLNSLTQVQAASALQVGRTMVSYARRVLQDDGPAVPELRQAVKEWRIRVSDAATAAKKPPEIQRRALDLLEEGKFKTVTGAVRQVERDIREQENATKRVPVKFTSIRESVTLHAVSVEDLHAIVPEASVDFIITTPRPDRNLVVSCKHLADFAVHALKDTGGLAVVGLGQLLPAMLNGLYNSSLNWVDELDLAFDGPPFKVKGLWHDIAISRLPVLVFGKQDFHPEGLNNLLHIPAVDQLPPGLSRTGAAIEELMAIFTSPGQVVCDPAMLGRHWPALAGWKNGCQFIGADDPKDRADDSKNPADDSKTPIDAIWEKLDDAAAQLDIGGDSVD